MKIIFKHKIIAQPPRSDSVPLRKGYKILSVGEQSGEIYLWALVDTSAPAQTVDLIVAPTGRDLDETTLGEFIGTVQLKDEPLVFHIFTAA